MDVADAYGVPLTFFVEVLNKHYFGEGESRGVCEYILERGHDVQLHLHPNWLNFNEPHPGRLRYKDAMAGYSLERQTALIAEGKALMAGYCGRPPLAFRAGNFGADRNTLEALRANGIRIDSSYTRAYASRCGRMVDEPLNDAVEIEGVLELPVTSFIETIPLRGPRFKPLDLNGVSLSETTALLEHAYRCQSPMHVTVILHSFSLLKAKDVQYRECGIRRYVLKRLAGLCKYLRDHDDKVACLSLTQLHASKTEPERPVSHAYPRSDLKHTLHRMVEQKVHA
jgi:hypothetical protein